MRTVVQTLVVGSVRITVATSVRFVELCAHERDERAPAARRELSSARVREAALELAFALPVGVCTGVRVGGTSANGAEERAVGSEVCLELARGEQ